MRKVNVEIAEDASRSEGGYAIVLLHGVHNLPDRARFRIKPVDARDAGDGAESWPKGEQTPVAVRASEQGIELVIGPEIVECPALLPGTVGVIEIPAAGVRGEFLWPSIRPTARPRRRHLSINRAPRGPAPLPPATPGARLTAATSAARDPDRTQTPIATPPSLQLSTLHQPPAQASPPSQATIPPAVPPQPGPQATAPPATQSSSAAAKVARADKLDIDTQIAALSQPLGGALPPPLPHIEVAAPLRSAAIAERAAERAAADAGKPTEPKAGDPLKVAVTAGTATAASSEPAKVSDTVPSGPVSAHPVTPPLGRPVTAVTPRGPAGFQPRPAHASRPRRLALVAASTALVLSAGYMLIGPYLGSDEKAAAARARAAGDSATASHPTVAASQPTADRATESTRPPVRAAAAAAGPSATATARSTIDDRYLEGTPRAAREAAAGNADRPPQPEPTADEPRAVAAAAVAPTASAAMSATAAQPAATSAAGTEVTLKVRGGGFELIGELKGYDGTKYLIETRTSGLMTMDASRFECQGPACARKPAPILPPTERPSPLKPDKVVIEGSPLLGLEFMPRLIESYATSIGATSTETPGNHDRGTQYRLTDARGAELATIDLVPGSNASALSAFEQGSAAIALVERPVGADDEARTPPRGTPSVVEHPIGLDGIAVAVAPGNATASLSIETLAKVFVGQLTDWVELGQAPAPIQLYLPPEGSGTLEAFQRLVLKPRNLKLTASANFLASDSEAAAAAARDPRGLALASFAVVGQAKALNLETSCGLISRPTAFGVKTEEYPLARRLSLIVGQQPALPSVRGLVRVMLAGDAARAVQAAQLIDQSIALLPLSEQSERMAAAFNAPAAAFDMEEMRQMLAELAGYSRLSTSLRFNADNDLDARSRREIVRLAAALKEPALAGRRITLAGFTDGGGRFQANLTIGLKRAGQVRTALLAAAGLGLDGRLLNTRGFGALAPIGCNTTAEGQRMNRRVEVWVAGDTPPKSAAR